MTLRPSRRGAFFLPGNDAPNGKCQLNYIQCGTAVKSEPEVVAQPCGIAERPEPEAKTVLFYIEDRACETDYCDRPSECGNHAKSPFLHISAKRGFCKLNSRITSAGVTFSRYESSSFPALSVKTTRISGEPIRQEIAQCTSGQSGCS